MSQANSTVTVSLKFALVGGGMQALDQAGNKVGDLIKLEQKLEQQVQRTGAAQRQKRTPPGTPDDSYGYSPERLAAQKARWDASDHAERRSQVLGSLYAQRERETARTDRERAEANSPAGIARKVVEQRQERDAVAAELRKAGYDESGGKLEAAGLSLAARAIGVGATAAGSAAHLVATAGNQQQNPYTSARSRAESFYRGVPVLGTAFGTGVDIGRNLSGESRLIGEQIKRADEQALQQQLTNALNLRSDSLRREEGDAGRRVEAFTGQAQYRGPLRPEDVPYGRYAGPGRTPGVDRGTVAGQRQYEEESRLLPVKRELAKLDRERWAAGKAVEDSAGREKQLAGELARIDKQRAEAKQAYEDAGQNGGTGAGAGRGRLAAEQDALNQAANLDKERKGIQERLEAEQGAGREARSRAAELAARDRQLNIQKSREELAIAREREQQAGDKSVSLSQAGIGGRETAKVALQMAKDFGIEALPPELRSSIGQVAPDTLRRLETEDGDRYKGEFDGLVDKGERGFDRDKDARKRTDAAEAKVFGQEDAAAIADVTGIQNAISGFANRVVEVVKAAIQAEVEAITVERMRANLSGGH